MSLPPLPPGYHFVIDDLGRYVIDDDGNYVIALGNPVPASTVAAETFASLYRSWKPERGLN